MPVAVFRTHRLAPRVVMGFPNVIQADWPTFYDLMDPKPDDLLVLYGRSVGIHREPGGRGGYLRDHRMHRG